MNLSHLFIARPIATALLAVAVALVGLLGYRLLPVSALPQVDFPTIQVTTQLPGASADTMTSLVTTPLERQFGQIAGLTLMTSTSSESNSAITLQFSLSEDIDVAAEDVQAAINSARGVLPSTLPYPPVYAKVNPADPPIMTLALTSDTLPIRDLNDVADTLLALKLSEIDGVGRVEVEGGVRPALRIQADPRRLAAYGLSLEDLRTALSNANVNLPKGGFDGPAQSMSLNSNDQITEAAQYEDMIVATVNGAALRLKDVAQVVEGEENSRTAGWVDGKPAVILDIQRQPGANIVATADALRRALPKLTQSLPTGLKMAILDDRTTTIRASVSDVRFTLVLTVGLVILVLFLFLRRVRSTIIPAVALPLSLIVTFGVMAAVGFGLDNLSLMALTIASGFVVDDAIVMIENIVRFIEAGDPPLTAAYKGAKEIGFTVMSLTVSLIAVFIPLLFMTGIVGRLFREFSLTLTFAVLASLVISLTLTPMMCAHLLKAEPAGTASADKGGRFFEGMRRAYGDSLAWVLDHGALVLLIFAATLVGTVWLYLIIPKGFLPLQDTGLIEATTDAPDTVSFATMSNLQNRVSDIVRADPDVTGVASFLGVGTTNVTPNSGHLTIVLKPRTARSDSATDVIARLAPKLEDIPGVEVHMEPAQDIQISSRASRTQFQYTLSDLDADELALWTGRLMTKLRALPLLTDVATDQEENGLAANIRIDRDAATRLGVLPSAIDNTLYDAFGQRQVTTIFSQANQYRVILEVDPRFRDGPAALDSVFVRASGSASASTTTTNGSAAAAASATSGTLVPLSAFARRNLQPAALAVTHQGQFPSTTISFNLAPGASLGDAVDALDEARQSLGMPEAVYGDFSGDAAEFRSSLADEPLLIAAAVVVIYIVLGILYESLIHPITILSTLPSAGVGALLALMITGQDLSLVALIGIVLLMGIVKKNAIMMIDFALEAERKGGKSPREAIFQASLLRFRPIMMTTMAALLGALPLAFDQGTGAELRRPLGITIVGGLLLSQLLTLYTTPVIYLAMERVRLWLGGRPAAPEERRIESDRGPPATSNLGVAPGIAE